MACSGFVTAGSRDRRRIGRIARLDPNFATSWEVMEQSMAEFRNERKAEPKSMTRSKFQIFDHVPLLTV